MRLLMYVNVCVFAFVLCWLGIIRQRGDHLKILSICAEVHVLFLCFDTATELRMAGVPPVRLSSDLVETCHTRRCP